jgi:hypothetical protein
MCCSFHSQSFNRTFSNREAVSPRGCERYLWLYTALVFSVLYRRMLASILLVTIVVEPSCDHVLPGRPALNNAWAQEQCNTVKQLSFATVILATTKL